ncbi:hypothetical protein V5O48_006242 [Marasmius crinis-equi]|uniref:Uncharacterized protein n=1 Tax=Marasmius crinis-equi TaxID=585013 RepID=A0ABR3FK20_9AGAR
MDTPLRSPQFGTYNSADSSEEKAAKRSSYVIRSPSHRTPRFSSISNGLPSPQQPFIHDPYSDPPTTRKYRNEIPKPNPIVSTYLSVSWMFGFREKFSLLYAFIFGGALFGFCLARSLLMDAGPKMRENTVAGEFFWFDMPLYKYNYIIHIYLSIIGGIFSGAQFVPTIRRGDDSDCGVLLFRNHKTQNYVLLHRINGYFVLITLFAANVTGAIVTRRSFGGELNSQSVYYITAIMSNFSFLWAIYNVKKDTKTHRKWMMRGVVYFSVVISARIIGQAAHAIVTDIGSYYSIWRCDEILYVLQDLSALVERFPQCSTSTSVLTNPTLYTAVHCSDNEGKLGKASTVRATQGMVLWIATLLHVVGVEIYLRSTEEANSKRHGYALEPKDFDPDRDMYSVHY